MYQHALIYLNLFIFIVVIYLCCLKEVNCDENNLELWRNEDAINKSKTSENNEYANLVKTQFSLKQPLRYFGDNRVKRPFRSQSRLSNKKSKVLVDVLLSYMGNSSRNNSINWSKLDLKSIQRDLHRKKRSNKDTDSEASGSEAQTDTEIEKEKTKYNETGEKTETVTERVIGRIGNKNHKAKTITEAMKYTKEHVKNKYIMEIVAKRETGKTSEGEMINKLERDTEKTIESKGPAEKIKTSEETDIQPESVTQLMGKNIIRQKKDEKDINKKHHTIKRLHYDRNRDRWQDHKKRKNERQRLEDKERLREENSTTNSYALKNKETRHPNETDNGLPESLRQGIGSTKAPLDNINEPSMDTLNPYSLTKQLQKILCELQHTNVTLTTIGRTAGYNDIILLQASELYHKHVRSENTQFSNDPPEKKIIFIVHGLNIWGFSNVPYLSSIQEFILLLKNYMEHLDKFDIYLVPMANPDGVAYSRHKYVWNKNMSPQEACPGVMLDRNFDVAFNEGPQLSSCSQQYAGNHAFSESETQAIREVFHRLSHRIIAYIHVHAGGINKNVFKGDAVLYPKGFSDVMGDDDKYIDLKGEIEETIRNASFKVMSVNVDTLYNWYGKVTGTSVDYASTVYGIPFALEFTMQLYDYDYYEAAQNEIWHRLIDVIFRYIYKTTVKTETESDLRKHKNVR